MKKLLLIAGWLMLYIPVDAQTIQSSDINNGAGNANPNALTVFDNMLILAASDDTYGHELWKCDANFNVARVNDNNTSGDGANPSVSRPFGVIADTVYYSGQDNGGGYKVYAYDGINTPYAINGGASAADPDNFTVLNGKLYYSAQAGGGRELFSYDPVAGTEVQVTGASPGSVYYDEATAFNGKIYYAGNTGINGIELYEYDPVGNNYSMVHDINPGGAHSTPSDLKVFNGKLYFYADNDTNDYQLYAYDGTNPPARLTGIAGTTGPASFSYTFYNGNIYFGIATNASSPATHALYEYDMSTGNTTIVKTILSSQPAAIAGLTVFNNRLYFSAKDSLLGEELWMYEGTNDPTLVADVRLGGAGSSPFELTVFQNHLYFSAKDDQVGRELFRFSDAGLGVQQLGFRGQISVFPNPVGDILKMDIYLERPLQLDIVITDLTGKIVYKSGLQSYAAGKNKRDIRVTEQTPGYYFYRLMNENGNLLAGGKLVKE